MTTSTKIDEFIPNLLIIQKNGTFPALLSRAKTLPFLENDSK